MRFKYIIYPEAMERFNSLGIPERIQEARDRDDLFHMGMISQSDVVDIAKEMKEEGILKHMPEEVWRDLSGKLNEAFKSRKDHPWKVHRHNGEIVEEELEEEDILGMIGWLPSKIFKPEEVFDYQKFGFRNLTDLTGSVAALINNALHGNFHEGYRWKFETEDGRTLDREITGDGNADLRIFSTDITPYETFDPIGNQVSYRPEMNSDREIVAAYHSTEDHFLAALLKWVEQCDIETETLKNKAQETIEWTKSFGQRIGTTTEHLYGAADEHRNRMAFIQAGMPLPLLDENDRGEQSTSYGFIINSDSHYGIYVGTANDLVFVVESRTEVSSPEKEIKMRFMPEEADHMIKGILYQSAKGLGRTSAEQLTSMLEYRFSPQYEADLREFSR